MRFSKVIQRRIRRAANGVDFVSDVTAAVAANVGERSQTTVAESRTTASAGDEPTSRSGEAEREEDQSPEAER
jgi:hypothetical protein